MGYHIKADGTVTKVTPATGKKFTLEEMQKFVGGYIEIVPAQRLQGGIYGVAKGMSEKTEVFEVPAKAMMVLNEEGKLKGLPRNEVATQIYKLGFHDPIVGDVLICMRGEIS
jgi:hypothetical protein